MTNWLSFERGRRTLCSTSENSGLDVSTSTQTCHHIILTYKHVKSYKRFFFTFSSNNFDRQSEIWRGFEDMILFTLKKRKKSPSLHRGWVRTPNFTRPSGRHNSTVTRTKHFELYIIFTHRTHSLIAHIIFVQKKVLILHIGLLFKCCILSTRPRKVTEFLSNWPRCV